MTGTHGASRRASLSLIVLSIVLSSCSLPALPLGNKPAPTSTVTPLPVAVATPTPVIPRTLTVCLGEEPNTLYPFGNPNEAAQSVLAAIDDGPIDTISYDYQPVILKKLPSLADGDAQILPVDVKCGHGHRGCGRQR